MLISAFIIRYVSQWSRAVSWSRFIIASLLIKPTPDIKFMKSLPSQPARWDEEQAGVEMYLYPLSQPVKAATGEKLRSQVLN